MKTTINCLFPIWGNISMSLVIAILAGFLSLGILSDVLTDFSEAPYLEQNDFSDSSEKEGEKEDIQEEYDHFRWRMAGLRLMGDPTRSIAAFNRAEFGFQDSFPEVLTPPPELRF